VSNDKLKFKTLENPKKCCVYKNYAFRECNWRVFLKYMSRTKNNRKGTKILKLGSPRMRNNVPPQQSSNKSSRKGQSPTSEG
jgi:hypothetical protein